MWSVGVDVALRWTLIHAHSSVEATKLLLYFELDFQLLFDLFLDGLLYLLLKLLLLLDVLLLLLGDI